MLDVIHIELLPELLTLSFNFNEPIGILVGTQTVTGIIEDLTDDCFMVEGNWYLILDVQGVEP
ncbi:hypothetical protein [Cohnella yongneupensis]|uniref:Uncharacterized protein n=1 Tax=Cohnella yongneupensis TaxID=425006 RepID=A0ABW0QVK4_9BACL